ncbi:MULTISPECIES: ABC transporter permease [Stenotrophomonas]|uniref:ABC transporter permease n=1 Tax=Stenotrophomonas maltophilia TaxID=40324 RepID=A0AAI9C3B5_STEMA|nr:MULTISPECIES: ABC transporter permease [Stenotrophomonas]UUS15179.1 ABC transporter permease [Stenotrophomonas sp. CD2]AWT16737.1 ABC transporter ATP-binding protein [Stenotrophomonas maltophilia]EKT4093364.1 ABC transporter permease [Stenotrophomonas maltophilia]MBA0361470.1 FtsX-like permease family protein [Stenotrophomonas maltophilia]MRI41362.1 FtsX-like permease family protein [Stenotrophomonas sp. MH181796]
MHGYYIKMSLIRFKQRVGTHLAIALMLGAGVGITTVMLSIVLQASSDPAPGRSSALFRPYLDARPDALRSGSPDPGQPLTWPDAKVLLNQGRTWKQAAMAGGAVTLSRPGESSARLRARFATSELFSVLGIAVVQGRAWTAEEGHAASRVVVLSRALAERECTQDCVGHRLELGRRTYTVVGVAEDWHPVPMFQGDLTRRPFVQPDEIYLPVETAIADKLTVVDGTAIWGGDQDTDLAGANVSWLQLWAWLPTADDVATYRASLNAYAQEKGLRIGPGTQQVALWPLMDWLDRLGLVPEQARMQLRLSLILLGVCIVNAAALLSFSLGRRRRELAIRRALGARRRDVFIQLMWESIAAGVASSALAVVTYTLGIRVVAAGDVLPSAITAMHAGAMLMAAGLGVVTTLLCSLVPSIEICRVSSLSSAFAKGAA